MNRKKSLLMKCAILGGFANTLTVDDPYSLLYCDKLRQPIQMQLFKKRKTFSQFLLHFWDSDQILNILKKKMTLIAYVFPKLETPKVWLDKCLKSPVSEDPWTKDVVNGPKHCWNLHNFIFIIFIDHCKGNWVGESHS